MFAEEGSPHLSTGKTMEVRAEPSPSTEVSSARVRESGNG